MSMKVFKNSNFQLLIHEFVWTTRHPCITCLFIAIKIGKHHIVECKYDYYDYELSLIEVLCLHLVKFNCNIPKIPLLSHYEGACKRTDW